MHYTIRYDMSDPAVARRKAINDAIRYSRGIVKSFIKAVRSGEVVQWEHACFLLAFAGITGLPARALWCYASGKDQAKLFPDG